MKDNVLVNVRQLCDIFQVKERRVRGWREAGILRPILRKGRGRSQAMLFSRGEVAELVYGYCQWCGGGYRRKSLKQRFCRDRCRKTYHYRTHKARELQSKGNGGSARAQTGIVLLPSE